MNRPIVQKHNYIRSKVYTDAAKDQPCTVCGANDGTTVFCHLNESWAGKGKGIKADDIAGFDGCVRCHRDYDEFFNGLTSSMLMRAIYLTLKNRIDRGIITIKGHKP